MKYETYQYNDEEKEEYMDLLGERDGDPSGVRTYKYENIPRYVR